MLLVVRKKEKYNRLICRQLDRLLVSRRFIVSSGLHRSRQMLCRYCNFAVKYPLIYLLPTLVHLRRREYAQRSQRAAESAAWSWNLQLINPACAGADQQICNGSTPCLRKNCANFFLSELRQISTNFGNFWQRDCKEAKIIRGALNFYLT